jgi:hypothetical protein
MNNKYCRDKVNFKKEGAYQHFLIIPRSCWSVVTWNSCLKKMPYMIICGSIMLAAQGKKELVIPRNNIF